MTLAISLGTISSQLQSSFLMSLVPHAHADDDLRGLVAGVRLEFDAHPAVALVGAFIVFGGDGVGEGEEGGGVAALGCEALEVGLECLVAGGEDWRVEHRRQLWDGFVELQASRAGIASIWDLEKGGLAM